MSLPFNMLSRFVIAFLPRSKYLFISWLQSSSAVIWEPKKIKSVTISIVSPSICHEVMGPDAMTCLATAQGPGTRAGVLGASQLGSGRTSAGRAGPEKGAGPGLCRDHPSDAWAGGLRKAASLLP